MITPGTCLQIALGLGRTELMLVYSIRRRPTNMTDHSDRNIVSAIADDGHIQTFSFTDSEFRHLCVIQI